MGNKQLREVPIFIFNSSENSIIKNLFQNNYEFVNSPEVQKYGVNVFKLRTEKIKAKLDNLLESDVIPQITLTFYEIKDVERTKEKIKDGIKLLEEFSKNHPHEFTILFSISFQFFKKIFIKENLIFKNCQFLLFHSLKNDPLDKQKMMDYLENESHLNIYKNYIYISNSINDIHILLFKVFGFFMEKTNRYIIPYKLNNNNTQKIVNLYKSEYGNFDVIDNQIGKFYVDDIEVDRTYEFNILICGQSGAGKSTFINHFNEEERAITGDGLRVTTKNTKYHHRRYPITIYDTMGFEPGKDGQEILNSFYQNIEKLNNDLNNTKDQFHCLLYLINAPNARGFSPAEKDLIRKLIENINIPIYFILTKVEFKKNEEDTTNNNNILKLKTELAKNLTSLFEEKEKKMEEYVIVNKEEKKDNFEDYNLDIGNDEELIKQIKNEIKSHKKKNVKIYLVNTYENKGFKKLYFDLFKDFISEVPTKNNVKEKIKSSSLFNYTKESKEIKEFCVQKAKNEVYYNLKWTTIGFGEKEKSLNDIIYSGLQIGLVQSIAKIYGKSMSEKESIDLIEKTCKKLGMINDKGDIIIKSADKIPDKSVKDFLGYVPIISNVIAFNSMKKISKEIIKEFINEFSNEFPSILYEKSINCYKKAINGLFEMSKIELKDLVKNNGNGNEPGKKENEEEEDLSEASDDE